MKKIVFPLVLVLLFTACGSQPEKQAFAGEQTNTDSIQTISRDSGIDAVSSATKANSRATFNGILVIPPQYHATVTLTMDGVIKSTSLLAGTFVKKGDLLATLENPEYITLQQAYIESCAQAEFLEAEYCRQEALVHEEAASQKKFQQTKADYLSMKSRKEATAAQLNTLGFVPAKVLAEGISPYLEVHSPIDGYIANVQVNLGKYVMAGTPLCDIIDKSKTLIKLTAYEKDIDKIKMGDKVEFRVNGLGTNAFNGMVVSLGQVIDNVNRSLEVYAKVTENYPQFRPGMYVNAQVVQK